MNARALLARVENPFMSSSMGFGSPLPRSFKHPGHENRPCGPFYGLLMAYLDLSTPSHEKRRYGLFWGLSGGALRLLKNLSWACLGFGVIPAPQSVVVFGAVRRVFVGRAWLSHAVCWAGCWVGQVLQRFVGLQEGAEVSFLFVSQRGTKTRSKRSIPRRLLLT